MSKNNIFNEDVIDFLSSKAKTKYDLIIADPPYNQNIADWDSFSFDEYWNFMETWISLATKKLVDGGAIWIFNNPLNSSLTVPILIKNKLTFKNWVTWFKKDGFGAPKTKFRTMQETILFFSKGDLDVFNYEDVRVPYRSTDRMEAASKKGIIKNGKRWFPNPNGALRSDVWEFSSQRHKTKVNGKTVSQGHATPKPHDLIKTIIDTHKKTDMKILDLFSGTGSTSIVAKKMNIDSDAVELDSEYAKIIEKELKNVK